MVTRFKFRFYFKGLLISVKLAKNADPDKYVYCGYSIGFILRSLFSLPNFDSGKNIVIFRVDMSSPVHIDNKKKDVLNLGIGEIQGLADTALTGEAKYSINFSRSNRKFCSSLHYNVSNSFLFVNATKIYQFKAKDSVIKKYPLCLGSISRDFSAKWVCVPFFC